MFTPNKTNPIFIIALLAAPLTPGCEGTSQTNDAGSDAYPDVTLDRANDIATDEGADDASVDSTTDTQDGMTDSSDAPVSALCGTTTCSPSEMCLRSVCVPSCNSVALPIETTLAQGWTVLGNICRTSVAIGSRTNGNTTIVYDVQIDSNDDRSTLTLSRWTYSEPNLIPAITTVFAGAYDRMAPATNVFGSSYVATNSDGTRAAFGFTTDKTGSLGFVFDTNTAAMSAMRIAANGNYSAVFLGNDLLVNGQGFGTAQLGQGLYTLNQQRMGNMGEYSGGLGLFGSDWLLAGATRSDFSTGIFAVQITSITSASTPIDAEEEAQAGGVVSRIEEASSFEVVGDVLYAADFDRGAIIVRNITLGQNNRPQLQLPTERPGTLATLSFAPDAAGYGSVIGLGANRIGLKHNSGILVLEPGPR